jgi:hypothetical protein
MRSCDFRCSKFDICEFRISLSPARGAMPPMKRRPASADVFDQDIVVPPMKRPASADVIDHDTEVEHADADVIDHDSESVESEDEEEDEAAEAPALPRPQR